MAPKPKIRRNSRGIEQVAKSAAVRRQINALAMRVAANVRYQGIRVDGIPGDIALPVEVHEQATDRARAAVSLAHPSGKAVQAKHGALTKAAAQVGLNVRSR